jgi:hypothetical protein
MTATKTAKTKMKTPARRTLEQISQQVEMALESDKTPEGVKDCLKTIIFEASNESGLLLGEILQDDFSRVRATFPNIIEKLGDDYGRGVLHSIHAIIQYNTDAFEKFYEGGFDQDTEDLANLLSKVMKHPKMPTRLYNVMTDELVENDVDTDSPEWILSSLKKMECAK